MNGWVAEWIDEWMDERIDRWMYEWMNVGVGDSGISGWIDG